MYDMKLHSQYSENWAIICKKTLGTNHTGGNDYWITLRGRSDRLSNDFVAMGIVTSEGKATVCEFISPTVVEYIEQLVSKAMDSWRADEAFAIELESQREEVYCMNPSELELWTGFMGRLPEVHAKMFTEIPWGERQVDRFFFAQTKKLLAWLREQKAEQIYGDDVEFA